MQILAIAIDVRAFFLAVPFVLFCFLLYRWGLFYHKAHVKLSSLTSLRTEKPVLRQKYAPFGYYFLLSSLFFFLLAFLDIHDYVPKEKAKEQPPISAVKTPSEGIAIYFVLDRSGSMAEEVKALGPEGKWEKIAKIDLLKWVTRHFIEGDKSKGLQGREGDMIGLVAFARGGDVLSPLTLDHKNILDQLEKIQVARDPNEDGTAIGYAIYKTANLIAATRHYAEDLAGASKPAYDIKSAVMILVTDGLQAPNTLDEAKRLRGIGLEDAAEYAKRNKVKMYVINVEPRLATQEFAAHRKAMEQTAETTGGKFYLADSPQSLEQIYAQIDRLEKSILPIETAFVTPPKSQLPGLYRRISWYRYFVAFGMACLFLFVVLEGVLMRRVP